MLIDSLNGGFYEAPYVKTSGTTKLYSPTYVAANSYILVYDDVIII